MARKIHRFEIKSGVITVYTVTSEDRKEAVNRAARYATEYAEAGFPDVSIAGIEKADFDAIEPVDGWPKTVMQ